MIRASLEPLFTEIRQQGLLVLPMPYGEDYDINGITRNDMRRIYTDLDGTDPGASPLYYGGEVFAATLPVIRQINYPLRAGEVRFVYHNIILPVFTPPER